jgi:hypothetical protein
MNGKNKYIKINALIYASLQEPKIKEIADAILKDMIAL